MSIWMAWGGSSAAMIQYTNLYSTRKENAKYALAAEAKAGTRSTWVHGKGNGHGHGHSRQDQPELGRSRRGISAVCIIIPHARK